VSSSAASQFHDAGVQTDFDGEKLPEGFVPYTQHRCYPLLTPLQPFCAKSCHPSFSRNSSGESGLYLRDVILGLNDGLVSMFLLLLGISGGGVKATEVGTAQPLLSFARWLKLIYPCMCCSHIRSRFFSLASQELWQALSVWVCPNTLVCSTQRCIMFARI